MCCGAAASLVAQTQHHHGEHRHPEAAKMQNPVKADATSIAAGQKLYDANCAGCHGDSGKGDGSMGADLNPKPSDLTDAEWKHGTTDGELFLVIRDGARNTGMKSFRSKLTTQQIWQVVNYIRSIGPAKSH
jgi:mono/diheme cytochrome c family protein